MSLVKMIIVKNISIKIKKYMVLERYHMDGTMDGKQDIKPRSLKRFKRSKESKESKEVL